MDAKPRELYLLFRAYKGYEGSLLKVTSKNGKTSSPVGFVTFTTRAGAEAAKLDLQRKAQPVIPSPLLKLNAEGEEPFLLVDEGVRFDPDLPQTIRLEFAKSNTKVSKPKQPSHPGLLHPISRQEMSSLLPTISDGWSHHPLSYTEIPVSTALHSTAIVHPALHAQMPPPLHSIPHAALHYPPHGVEHPNTQPTLFVTNLGHFVQDQELKDMYGSFPGSCRLRMHNKAPGSLSFTEYKFLE